MIITQTPLRISLLGGNTDFPKYFKKHGGACLAGAIDKYVYVIVKERFDDEIWINYFEKEIVKNVNDIKHDLVREAMKLLHVKPGLEITFLSDIPSKGSGLGSSSAILVGLLLALHRYKGEDVGTSHLAQEAVKIEIEILKKPIGYQDQVIVAHGGFNLIEFKTHEISFKNKYTNMLENFLMLFYTGKQRKTDKILHDMVLDKKILDKNKELAYKGYEILDTDRNKLANLINEYWDLKKQLNKKSTTPQIDKMLKKAMKLGAMGGKVVGAGGGGFILLVVNPRDRELFREKLGLKELPFNWSRDGSKVIFDIRK